MNDWSRREFIRLAACLAALPVVPACGGDGGGGGEPVDDAALPTLGGAPDTAEGRAIAAFCDTIVPGRHRDPKKAPGAIDVGAPALFFDPELPAAPYVGVLVAALDLYARSGEGKPFAELGVAARERTLEKATSQIELLDFAVQLAKLAFFSSAGAGAWLGYPGANAGYVSDPDFSFNRPMSREITGDGNLA